MRNLNMKYGKIHLPLDPDRDQVSRNGKISNKLLDRERERKFKILLPEFQDEKSVLEDLVSKICKIENLNMYALSVCLSV